MTTALDLSSGPTCDMSTCHILTHTFSILEGARDAVLQKEHTLKSTCCLARSSPCRRSTLDPWLWMLAPHAAPSPPGGPRPARVVTGISRLTHLQPILDFFPQVCSPFLLPFRETQQH